MQAAIAAALSAYRDELRARYGWADANVHVEVHEGRVLLRGSLVVPRRADALRLCLSRALPGTPVELVLEAWPAGTWHAVEHALELWRECPRRGSVGTLATELGRDDGPVELVTQEGPAYLLRAVDGTLGWTAVPLGAVVPTPARPVARALDPRTFVSAVRQHLGTPYRLGGTTARALDCSGLVQRALRDAGDWLVPRHSADQLRIAIHAGAGADLAGNLVFVWSRDEAPCHVGVASGDGEVIHASRSRGVVVDVRDLFVTAARVAHVPFTALADLQTRLVGAARLSDLLPLG